MSEHTPEAHASLWNTVTCTDDRLRAIYLRHYSSSKARGSAPRAVRHPNELRFVGPGEYIALLAPGCDAGFVWRASRYRKDGQTGIECTMFRNETRRQSSCYILGAMWFAEQRWAGERLFTYVDPASIRPTTNPGYCFIAAGWRRIPGETGRGLVLLESHPGGES